MIEWWSTLDATMKVVWAVTLSATLIFVIQTILTFIGADADSGDFDTDFDGDFDGDLDFDGGSGMNLYTFRNFINFLLGFGWSTILLKDSISSTWLLVTIAILIGVALVTVVMYIFKWLYGMQSSGNINVYKSAAGCQGKVYLTIPAARSGVGKVQITINNSVREYDALTDEDEVLKTGEAIKVVEVLNPSTLVVERINSLIV